jgi:multidrug efflux pump subunit AcrB
MLRLALDKPVVVVVGILILSVFGLAAVLRVPIQMIPDMDPRIVSVTTVWPGATPRDIEQEILVEQEEFLRGINGLVRMDSQASFGRASVELEFPFGTDINDALIRVNNALSQMTDYPENVDQPRISTSSTSENSFAYFRVIPRPGNPGGVVMDEQLDWVEDNIKRRLERVPGVSRVSLGGVSPRQVNVYVDPAQLAARGLTLMDVRRSLRSRNRDVSGGDMDFGKRRYMIRTVGRFQAVEEINELILAERNGAFIRLRDVGYAELGKAEQRSYSFTAGERSLSMTINKQSGSNVVEVLDDLLSAVDDLNNGLAAERGLEIQLSSEDVRYVKDSVRTVLTNLAIGAVLASLVLLAFLRSATATLIGALGIPVCTLAAFLGLSLTGRTINVISLAGVAFAIGMTLDNSIVALETISRHIAQGKQRYQATLDGITEVWPAILASTLTTVLVFLPIALLQDEAGQLYGDIAIAISASIVMSMLVAVALVPAACRRFLREAPEDVTYGGSGNLLLEVAQMWATRLLAMSQWFQASNRRRGITLGVTLLLTIAVFRFLTPATSYLPEGEESKIFAFMFAPGGYNLEAMMEAFNAVDPEVSSQVRADSDSSGEGESAIPPIVSHVAFLTPERLLYVTEPTDPGDTLELKQALGDLFGQVPGMQSFTARGSIFSDNRGGTRSINVEISGGDLRQLFDLALVMLRRSQSLLEGAQIRSEPPAPSLYMSQPMAYVRPDWDRASELQVSQDELGYTLWAYSDGAFVDEFFLDDDKLDIYLFSTRGSVTQPADLEQVMLHTGDGDMVPLAALARVEERVGAASIPRVNGLRTVTLTIVPPRSMALETGAAIVRTELLQAMRDAGEIPEGVSLQVTGATSKLEQTRAALSGNFALAIMIAYLLLVAVFSHWGYPLLIMTTVPIGIGGGVIGLWCLNAAGAGLGALGLEPLEQPLDVITMLGFLVLVGTVVNNPILLVDRTINNIKRRGMAIADAIEDATRVRLRPVLMSTITTIFGLAPLVFLPGAGAELYRGLGAVVLSGLLLSSLVTLLVLPTLLRLVLELTARPDQRG